MPTPKKKETALMKAPDESVLALLRAEFPTEPSFQRSLLPRFTHVSQDVTEETGTGKNKTIKVITAAGTFQFERQTEDVDEETGKQIWATDELEDETVEGIILFQRKQLRMYDEATEQYTSSPVYDSDDEIVPLFCDKAEVDRGTPKELQAKYMGVSKKTGKPKTNLEDNRILYVLIDGEMYQMNLRGTSMYAYMDYARKTRPAVPAVLTSFGTEPKENGAIKWNQVVFKAVRPLDAAEVNDVVERVKEIKGGLEEEKAFFAERNATDAAFAAHKSSTDESA